MNVLVDRIMEIERRIAEVERRSRNRRRTGTVAEVDHERGLYRVKLGSENGQDYLTDWIRPKQIAAGQVKIDFLLKQGEQVDVISENGDLTDAMIEGSAYSNTNGRENNGKPLHLVVDGDGFIKVNRLSIEGNVEIKGSLDVDGERVTHNKTNIGDTHKHGGVLPGSAKTDKPE